MTSYVLLHYFYPLPFSYSYLCMMYISYLACLWLPFFERTSIENISLLFLKGLERSKRTTATHFLTVHHEQGHLTNDQHDVGTEN